MKKFYMIFLLILMNFASALAEKSAIQMSVDSLQRELNVLKKMRDESLLKLEKAEAKRWDARYKQNAVREKYEADARNLELKYGREASQLGLVQQNLSESRKSALEAEEGLNEAQRIRAEYMELVQQSAEKTATGLERDLPVEISERTLLLSNARDLLKQKNPDEMGAVQKFFAERFLRLEKTEDQFVQKGSVLFAEGGEKSARRLRLGTIFSTDISDDASKTIQVLLHTGSLQGKTYVWRSGLSKDQSEVYEQVITSAFSGDSVLWVPLDLLQNGKIIEGLGKSTEITFSERFKKWFASGGLVMYPLFLTAFLALLMGLERWWVYYKRGRRHAPLFAKILPLLEQRKFNEVEQILNQTKGALARVLIVIVQNSDKSRVDAEKQLRESMLKEIPFLEKRLNLIAALGTSAPLLGLLGTVSGMINLFRIITEMGTNDARILAGGISEALVTTQTGLIIAIPVLLLHGWLSENLDSITSSLNSHSLQVLNILWPKAESK